MTHDPITFADTAPDLHEQGYRPFAGRQESKIPAMKGWNGLNEMSWDDAGLEACIADYQPASDYCCCIAVQKELVVADIDITDPVHATYAINLAERVLGPTPLVRVGNPPKQALIYRNDGSIRSHKLHPFEVFAGSGQVVAFGWHSKAGRPYQWLRETPLNTPADSTDIPIIGRTTLEQFEAELFRVVPRRTFGSSRGRQNQTIGGYLRMRTIMLGNWKRAAAEVLGQAEEGFRNETMWAVVASAAGRGIDEDELRQLFDTHFVGWDGVTVEDLDSAIERCRRTEVKLADWTPPRGPIRRLHMGVFR